MPKMWVQKQNPTQWIYGLTMKDREILVNGEWLTDDLIDATQSLIKRQFPHVCGLQNVALGRVLSFNINSDREFIQILHLGHGHWVTVSTIGCWDGEIFVYDSPPMAISSSMTNQIAS